MSKLLSAHADALKFEVKNVRVPIETANVLSSAILSNIGGGSSAPALEPSYEEKLFIKNLAKSHGILEEKMRERLDEEAKAYVLQNEKEEEIYMREIYEEKSAKIHNDCVYFDYHMNGYDITKYTNDERMHGWFFVVKTSKFYEFTLMETDMEKKKHEVGLKTFRFGFDEIKIGKGSFENVTPDKIFLVND